MRLLAPKAVVPDARLDRFRDATAELVSGGRVVGCLMTTVVPTWTGALWWKKTQEGVDVLFAFDDSPANDLAHFYMADDWLTVAREGHLFDQELSISWLSGSEHDYAKARAARLHGLW